MFDTIVFAKAGYKYKNIIYYAKLFIKCASCKCQNEVGIITVDTDCLL